jgi:group I intron endonuclease
MTPSEATVPPKRPDKPGIIYLAKNKVNGKLYVGQTVKTLACRRSDHKHTAMRGSEFVFHASIRKYGMDQIEFSVLQRCCGRVCLTEAEKWWIAHLNSMVPNGYNLTAGGEGATDSEETRKKKSEAYKRRVTPEMMKAFMEKGQAAARGSKWTPERHEIRKARQTPEEERRKISLANKGKRRSEESCKRISAGKTGKPQPHMIGNQHAKGHRHEMTPEIRRKIAESKIGKPRSEETKRKLSEALKGKPGHPCSEDLKIKLSQERRGKPFSGATYRGGSKKKFVGSKFQMSLDFRCAGPSI